MFDPRRTIDHVIHVADGKTASLFQASCRVGGIVGRLDEHAIIAIGEFGHAFGLGFQLLDDLQDLTAGRNDLHNGVYTDAIVTAAEQDSAIAELLANSVTTEVLVQRAVEVGAIEHARQRAADWFTRAAAKLHGLDNAHAAAGLARLAERYRIRTCELIVQV